MILIDFSQTCLSYIFAQRMGVPDISYVRNGVLDSLRFYKKNFASKYGETIVLACDSKTNWRKDAFKYYKFKRKDIREKSTYDWNLIFSHIDTLKQEFKQFMPYYVIETENAEADDVIATLSLNPPEETNQLFSKVLIISSDKDFKQLHHLGYLDHYSPQTKGMIKVDRPDRQLKEMIMRGDTSDGIPNFLSPDNCFYDKIKQTPIMSKKVSVWLDQKPEEFCDETTIKNYKRNELLIDLKNIPTNISEQINSDFLNHPKPSRKNMFDYFFEKSVPTKNLQEF